MMSRVLVLEEYFAAHTFVILLKLSKVTSVFLQYCFFYLLLHY